MTICLGFGYLLGCKTTDILIQPIYIFLDTSGVISTVGGTVFPQSPFAHYFWNGLF